MKKYNVTDGNGDIEIAAATHEAACQEYVDGGDWGDEAKTSWVTVSATEIIPPCVATVQDIGGGTYLVWGPCRMYLAGQHDGVTMQTIDAVRRVCSEVGVTDNESMLEAAIDAAVDATDGAEAVYIEWESLDGGTWSGPDSETHTIEIPPTVPDCCGGEHEFRSPFSVVGGCKENPGVYGHGGGVIMTEVCCLCGCYQITDTWAQNPENGEQGLRSVEYLESDDESEAWLTRRQEAAEAWVRDHSDSDDLSDDDLEINFAKYFRRPADDKDRENGLWSLLCQAVGVESTVCGQ